MEDVRLLGAAFRTLHPGLFRYREGDYLEASLADLSQSFSREQTLGEAYLAILKFTASIHCGHTYANFWNQPQRIRQVLFDRADKVPFSFRLVERRMIVEKNASEEERLSPGAEIVSINGQPASEILDHLLEYVKGDGENESQRLYQLQLFGYGEFEAFDIYFPLLFPPRNGRYRLEVRPTEGTPSFETTVAAIGREERKERLDERYDDLPKKYDDLWEFRLLDEQTGYLKLGTFVTWKMEMNWKKFLDDAFRQLKKKSVPYLILDIRGNGGGDDAVIEELSRRLVSRPVTITGFETRLRYDKVPKTLRPHIGTWDNQYLDLSKNVEPAGNGFFRIKDDQPAEQRYTPARNAYRGEVILLVDAANSSATFLLSRAMKQTGLATLIGQPTGGNLKGINGGMILMLNLPNTGIEVDIPVFGFYPLEEQPDQGVLPDVEAEPSAEDIRLGKDSELQAARAWIQSKKK